LFHCVVAGQDYGAYLASYGGDFPSRVLICIALPEYAAARLRE
jgi:hypothetical protein